jgi:hypothetical protein
MVWPEEIEKSNHLIGENRTRNFLACTIAPQPRFLALSTIWMRVGSLMKRPDLTT